MKLQKKINFKRTFFSLPLIFLLLTPLKLQANPKNSYYEQDFMISAYYSPIPGQKHYVRGSLEADKKLNGNGTNGADGTPVFPGMIAAPPSYPFGTKMYIEGIGTVSVHDRGGAIKSADGKSRLYDRLDIWMGHGDEGLSKALSWGKRIKKVKVYTNPNEIQPNVDLSNLPSSLNLPNKYPNFTDDLNLGETGEKVTLLQSTLKEAGFYNANPTSIFDQTTFEAVQAFQIHNKIIDSTDDFGAGYVGPQTRLKLEELLKKEKTNTQPKIQLAQAATTQNNIHTLQQFSENLTIGSSGSAVVGLQKELNNFNLFGIETTGFYGEVTANAVKKFQQRFNIIEENLEPGTLGPKTRAKMNELIAKRQEIQLKIAATTNSNQLAIK